MGATGNEYEPHRLAQGPVADFFMRIKRRDPSYYARLADRLWKELSPDQQDIRTAIYATIYPDDTEARGNAIRAGLIIEYINHEQEVTDILNRLHGSNMPPMAESA